jgi:16S rRNA pseudouridine516 synthase
VPRIDALIARNLGLSRRQVLRLIRAGRILDHDGATLDDPRRRVLPSAGSTTVRLDGNRHVLHHRFDVLLDKPAGVVTALRDATHPTAYALLDGAPLQKELRAVGRLDKDTTGLLLWTTDGTLLHKLTHPRYAVPRTYHAALRSPWSPLPEDLVLDDGHRPRITELAPIDRDVLHASTHVGDAIAFATITVTTGRFHEVRRIFAALGTEVVGLCRVRYGPIELPKTLGLGRWMPVDLHSAFHGLSPAP